jgi:uncharacterized protein with FMN-binding domain
MHSAIKPLVGLAFAGASSALVFGFRTSDPVLPATAHIPAGTTTSPTATAEKTATSGQTTPTDTADAGSKATATPAPAGTASTGQYADGTYSGAAIREPWGTFEVQAVISGGQLVDVKLIESPSDRHSSQINNIAVPLLTESAIANQSANVDGVSGATWTSESYAESLQAALDAASAAATVSGAAG